VHPATKLLLSPRVRRFFFDQSRVLVASRRGQPVPAGLEPFRWRRKLVTAGVAFALLGIVLIALVLWASSVLDGSGL
jgi:hypothetical protein